MTRSDAQNIAILAQCKTATMSLNKANDENNGLEYCYNTELKYLLRAIPILSCYEPYELDSQAQYAIASASYDSIKIESDDVILNVTVSSTGGNTYTMVSMLADEITDTTTYESYTEEGDLKNAFFLTAPDTIEGCVEYTVSIRQTGGQYIELFTGTIGCANTQCSDFDPDQLGINIKSLTEICCN